MGCRDRRRRVARRARPPTAPGWRGWCCRRHRPGPHRAALPAGGLDASCRWWCAGQRPPAAPRSAPPQTRRSPSPAPPRAPAPRRDRHRFAPAPPAPPTRHDGPRSPPPHRFAPQSRPRPPLRRRGHAGCAHPRRPRSYDARRWRGHHRPTQRDRRSEANRRPTPLPSPREPAGTRRTCSAREPGVSRPPHRDIPLLRPIKFERRCHRARARSAPPHGPPAKRSSTPAPPTGTRRRRSRPAHTVGSEPRHSTPVSRPGFGTRLGRSARRRSPTTAGPTGQVPRGALGSVA